MVTTEQLFYFIVIMSWLYVSILLFIGTFTLYVAIMKMREVKDRLWRLHWPVRWVCYLILLIGLIFDVLLNWVVCTISFLEFPREFLTTSRVVRHKYQSTGWRQAQAKYWCEHWLTPFDNKHCE